MKYPARALLILFLALTLTACSVGKNDPEPAVPPTATAVPTISPGGVSVGQVLDNVDTAWSALHSWQTTSWTQQGDVTSTPPLDGQVTIELVIPQVGRKITMQNNGIVVDEQMVVAARVYMKGRMVPAAIAPMVDTETWVEVDPRTASSSSPIAPQIAYLLGPMTSPFAKTLPETRGAEAKQTGTLDLDGRSCVVWTFGGGTDGITYNLAIDANNLPCQLVESASGYANVTTYAFNIPGATLVAPVVATPTAP